MRLMLATAFAYICGALILSMIVAWLRDKQ